MIYVIDTNELGPLERREPVALRHMERALAVPGNLVATTIVSVAERLNGRLPQCRHAQDGKTHVRAYADLQDTIQLLLSNEWLPFTPAAAVIFDQHLPLKQKIGARDLAIASITLSVNGILVTRNFADFQRVPNLVIEDWAYERPLT